MKRFTLITRAVVLVGTVLIGGTLVSAVLAATISPDATATPASPAASLSNADLNPAVDAATRAAADALAMAPAELSGRLANGSSLKEIADEVEVGYGTVARAMADAVSETLDSAVGDGSLTPQRANQIGFEVTSWIDAGGQPDAGWLDDPA